MKHRRLSTAERQVLSLFEPYVQEWIRNSFDRLTPPQIQAWPLIAEGHNTLIFSPTGSGKTLAAFLWCIDDIARGDIAVQVHRTRAPSPFAHSLLLVGQYGDFGGISNKERHARLMHLHREVLKQLLSEDELRSLLRREVIEDFVARRQHTHPTTRARDENEIVAILSECGGLSVREESDYSIFGRVQGDVAWMLDKLWREKRIVQIPMGDDTCWIATHDFPLFRDATSRKTRMGETDRHVMAALAAKGDRTLDELSALTGTGPSTVAASLTKLARAFLVVRAGLGKQGVRWARADRWMPEGMDLSSPF